MNDAIQSFDLKSIRAQFPILGEKIRGKDLVFLDSAASAQKPRAVIDAMVHAMERQYANIHRGLHWMSERTTEAYGSPPALVTDEISLRVEPSWSRDGALAVRQLDPLPLTIVSMSLETVLAG